MGSGYGREIEQLLTAAGCYMVRKSKGDHEIWYSPVSKRNFVFDRGVRVKHTANGTLKDAGLPKQF